MISPAAEVRRFLQAALVVPVEVERPDPEHGTLLRQVVAAVTTLTGAIALAATLQLKPGDPAFFRLGFALAGIWTIGAFLSGPLRLGLGRTRAGGRSLPVLQSVVLALLLLLVSLAGAAVVTHLAVLRGPVVSLLEHARAGPLPLVLVLTVVNGIAEELFFRGALQAALQARHAVAGTTVLYALTTVGSGVPLLVVAALALGLVTALQRRVTGGILGPAITHVIWSTGMLLLLPPTLNLTR